MPLSPTQTFLSTAFILGVGTFVLVTCGAFIGYAAAQRNKREHGSQTRLPWLLFLVIGVWFGVALATSTAGLISIELVLPFMLFPIVIGYALSFTPRLANLLREIPTQWLIGVQAYRAAGGIFIYPFLTEGILTRGFALNAGIGDILTGVLAVPVALLVMRDGSKWRWTFYGWTVLGILDLVVAVGSSVVFGFSVPGVRPDFPITIIPLFFGPPFGILIQLITLRNFQLRHNIAPESENRKPLPAL